MTVARARLKTGPVVAACAVVGSIASGEVDSLWYRTPRAGAALVPYAAWCSFATGLSAAPWNLDRGRRP